MDILIPTLKHWYVYQLVYPLALFWVKASILASYHRIFQDRKFRMLIYIVGGVVLAYTIIVIFVNVSCCLCHELRKRRSTLLSK